jgi:predicted RNA-binding protein (virulence factor B family)
MLKIKTVWYFAAHHLTTSNITRENLLLELVLTDQLDDVLCVVEGEKKKYLEEMSSKIQHYFNHKVTGVTSKGKDVTVTADNAKGEKVEIKGDYCLVKILRDHSGRVIAKEKLEDELSNENLTVKEMDVVELVMYQETPLGYQMIINGKHLGLLHKNETFKELFSGDKVEGFIKKIKEDNKIDVVLGKPGYKRVVSESEPILNALHKANGFLPYHDKSDAEEIQKVFGMSKKTFKMSIGALYKQKKIVITPEGIRLV